MKTLLAIFLAAVACQFWSTLSWMVLPWHSATITSISEPSAVLNSLAEATNGTGVYVAPGMDDQEAAMSGSQVYAFYREGASKSIGVLSGQYFFINLVTCGILVLILRRVGSSSFRGRFSLCLLIGLFAACVSHLPDWNWWSVPTSRTLVLFADSLVYSVLVGGILSALVRPKK